MKSRAIIHPVTISIEYAQFNSKYSASHIPALNIHARKIHDTGWTRHFPGQNHPLIFRASWISTWVKAGRSLAQMAKKNLSGAAFAKTHRASFVPKF